MTSRCSPRRAPSCTARCAPWSVRSRSWARAGGRPTTSRRRFASVTAPRARRLRRPTGFIWRGSIMHDGVRPHGFGLVTHRSGEHIRHDKPEQGEAHRAEIVVDCSGPWPVRVCAVGSCADLSRRDGTHHRSISSGRSNRRSRPRAQRASAEPLGSSGRVRISARRRRPARDAPGGEFTRRWIYAADGLDRRHPRARRRPPRGRIVRHQPASWRRSR